MVCYLLSVEKKYNTYWANTSGNGLVGKLLREGNPDIKSDFEELLRGGILETEIDEQIVNNQLDEDDNAIWSFLLASGYLKVDGIIRPKPEDESIYWLSITNYEVRRMFGKMVKGWFQKEKALSKFCVGHVQGRHGRDLLQRGIPAENILKYGFAFEGEKCLIRKA